jgi:hypothetical protein
MWKNLENLYISRFIEAACLWKTCGKVGEFSTEYKYLEKVFHQKF